MKIFQQIGLVILSSFALHSFAGEMVDKSLPANDINDVSIENLRGKVAIIGWDKAEVTLKGELDDEAEQLIFEQHGSSISIKVVMPRHLDNDWGVKSSDLTVHMPKNIRMNFSGVSSDVSLKNLLNNSEVSTVSGDIIAKSLAQHIDLSTVSGNVESRNLSGKIYLSSVSGDIDDRASAGRLKLKVVSGEIKTHSQASEVSVKNVSGNIDLTLEQVEELVMSSISGDIEGQVQLSDGGKVKSSSISGDIEITFQENVQASFRLGSSAGGDLINKLTSDKAKHNKYGPGALLHFQTGNASSSVKVSTVSGTIKVGSK